MADETLETYAKVQANNDRYKERTIVEDGTTNAIHNPDEDAIASIKGHIERQDQEGR
ncbi:MULTISPECIES: hypothetical protein [unclassified Paenibacillus]|uniref:hypothetical protein n=1 Tax=unclassified Paenibacillus TaxID=185978 RepID=UPI001AEB9E82|nr:MULTISPECIES: hypothetical protein [unclassified Paenibacillus]MBP1153728.1 hypothetical protein [Paenibacillus sp. PvP091]MBP1170887.1 hypothetical protein [Paenibacillus sp. PvR098]MBP2441915.1 hypothetical protein [Paenibacillus sp. PvP052]